jgi:hypothetical protein
MGAMSMVCVGYEGQERGVLWVDVERFVWLKVLIESSQRHHRAGSSRFEGDGQRWRRAIEGLHGEADRKTNRLRTRRS